jgi:hypothetical protein
MIDYQKGLKFLFDREETKGDWRWDIETDPFELKDQDAVEFFIRLTQDLSELLGKYSLWQIRLGLEYLFYNSISDFVFFIQDGSASIERRIDAIHAIKEIYIQVFEPMCEPILGNLSEKGNELNGFCYMLWDASPLSCCEGNPNKHLLYKALADVMNGAIYSNNIACIESGLHGLGHMVFYYSECKEIIQAFIISGKCSDKRILDYAELAKTGYIL